MPKNFLIFDANSILYRAFFALPKLTAKDGKEAGAVYGFLLVFLKLIKEFPPNFLAVCFDSPLPTFRHKEFKEYKAKRPPTPKELAMQILLLKEVLEGFLISCFEKDGVESDDLIGTLTAISPKDWKKVIVSGDSDLLQLVGPNTILFFLQKGVKRELIFDEKMVKERYGLEPWQIPHFKALVGDASDNIMGVVGIGPKTASQLLLQYGAIEKIFEVIEGGRNGIDKKIKERLTREKEKIMLNLRLTTIEKNVGIHLQIDKVSFGSYNINQGKEAIKRLGFKSILKRLEEIKYNNNLSLF